MSTCGTLTVVIGVDPDGEALILGAHPGDTGLNLDEWLGDGPWGIALLPVWLHHPVRTLVAGSGRLPMVRRRVMLNGTRVANRTTARPVNPAPALAEQLAEDMV